MEKFPFFLVRCSGRILFYYKVLSYAANIALLNPLTNLLPMESLTIPVFSQES